MTEQDESRAERALREALRQHADAPAFAPLRIDVTRPRRFGGGRWLSVAAGVAVVAVAGLLAQQLVGQNGTTALPAQAPAGGAPQADTRAETSSLPPARPGWRWESYRSLAYQVPATWGYEWSPGSDWCAQGVRAKPRGPYVDIGFDHRAVLAIGCTGSIRAEDVGMFVTARTGEFGWELPAGWKVEEASLPGRGGIRVVHSAADEALAQEITATLTPLDGPDANGCLPRSALQDGPSVVPSPGTNLLTKVAADRVSICQYDLTSDGPGLLASRTLFGAQAGSVLAALRSAPDGEGPNDPASCTADSQGTTGLVVRVWHGDVAGDVFVRYSNCRDNGVFDGTKPRKVTAEVCRALVARPIALTSGNGPAMELCIAGRPEPTPSVTR